ncbi:hypothetical protein [Actinoplanes sp. NPDC089786]|uniref:hypothetical protein n=1 Tax=Actinoplanes sp. NPDC089786 TaxID=3155185 RepID=UPI00341A74FB
MTTTFSPLLDTALGGAARLTHPDAEVPNIMTTLSVDAARKVCEIGLTVIPVFALAFLVSERDKLRIPLIEPPPAGESPEESNRRGRPGTYRQRNSDPVEFIPATDLSTAVQLATGLPFLLASLIGFIVALLGLIVRPAPWLLAIVTSCLLIVVFLFFVHVALNIAQSSFQQAATGTTPAERVRAVFLGRERGYLGSTPNDANAYERIGLAALRIGFLLSALGVLTFVGINVLILGFVRLG